jgi:predicted acylesterase/phospholipase RssA
MTVMFDLVFRGGGIKGAAFLGALQVLAKDKRKLQVRRMIGTSAGAIFATCFAAGYTPDQLAKELEPAEDPDDPKGGRKLPFALFTADPPPGEDLSKTSLPPKGLDGIRLGAKVSEAVRGEQWAELTNLILPYIPVRNIAQAVLARLLASLNVDADKAPRVADKAIALLLIGAACDDRRFRKWLDRMLSRKDIHKDLSPTMSLRTFHERISKAKSQQLSLIATDVTPENEELLVLNHQNAPDLPLREAVRMSVGIPFLWPEVVWKKGWGEYRETSRQNHLIVDGGLLSNFPLRFLLDAEYAKPHGLLGPPPPLPEGIQEANVRKVGLFLDDKLPANATAQPGAWYDALPLYRSANRVLDTMMNTWDQDALRHYPEEKRAQIVCNIGTKGFGTLEFDLKPDRLEELLNRGRCAMTSFLQSSK